jgi:hypothetical protein
VTLDLKTVEAILRRHWTLPSDLNQEKLNDYAFNIQVMVDQKYSHQNLKYQLSLMQTKALHQAFDDRACDQIASDLLKAAGT